ncbi:MAG: hypothetical protein KC897_01105 [Candidatus Omnitrophica bacterium]|nr:hypothetical protein [Candidatus Omnitrophota bacterium]MCB9720080.1 hypothetical protein [Candidatus Omnitrophota bacterium]
MSRLLKTIGLLLLMLAAGFVYPQSDIAAGNGELAVYREATGGEDEDSTTVHNEDFDTTVAEDGEFTLQTGGTLVNMETGGHYFVWYGLHFQTNANLANLRTEHIAHLDLQGTDLEIGYGQGYSRTAQTGEDEIYISGGGIINAAAGDDLKVEVQNTSSSTTQDVTRRANLNSLMLLKLDDDWDYIRLHESTGGTNYDQGQNTYTTYTWDTVDEYDTGSFTYTTGTGTLTLDTAGHYLVTHTIRLNTGASATRVQMNSRITVGGTVQEHCYSGTYIRGDANSNSANDGSIAGACIIETTSANQDLVIQLARTGLGSATTSDVGDQSAIAIVKLPDDADYIRVHESGGGQTVDDTDGPILWDTTDEEDAASFAHSGTMNADDITVQQDADYLFTSCLFASRGVSGDGTRSLYLNQWRVDGTTQSYGAHGAYNRGDQATTDAMESANCGVIILDDMTSGAVIDLTVTEEGPSTAPDEPQFVADAYGLTGVNINSLFLNVSGATDLGDGVTIAVAVNGSLQSETATTASGAWSMNVGRPVSAGDIITVWADGVTDANETTAVAEYDGSGDMDGLVLNANELYLGSNDNTTLDLAELGVYDQGDDEDILFTVTATLLIVDQTAAYSDDTLVIRSGNTLSLTGTQGMIAHNVDLNGTLSLTGTASVEVGGDWDATGGTLSSGTSTVLFDSGAAQTITGNQAFYNVEFNNAAGSWELQTTLNVDGTLTLAAGTLDTGLGSDNTINVAGNWTDTGTFEPREGLVNLDGGDQVITTTGTFYNLQKSLTVAGTLTFEAGITVGVTNNLVFNGAPGQLLGLVSSSPGTVFNLNVTGGTQQVSYVNVSDSEALSNDILAVLSVNGGGNDDGDIPPTDQWIFLTERYWVGPAGGNTSDAGNWSGTENACGVGGGAGVPTTLEVAIFSATCDNNATVDVTLNPGGMTIDAGHTGTITTNALLDIDGPFLMVGGTLDLDTNDTDVDISGNMTLSGGTYLSGTGTLTLNGILSFSDTVGNVDIGIVSVDGTAAIVTQLTDMTVTDLVIGSDDTLTPDGYDLTILNDLVIDGELDAVPGTGGNSTITIAGDWDMTNGTFRNTATTVVFDGTGSVTSNGKAFNDVQIGSATAGGSLATADDMDINGDLTVANGGATTLDISNDTLTVAQDLDFANLDSLVVTSSTVTFDGSGAQTVASDGQTYNVLEVTNTSEGGVTFTEGLTTTDFVNTTPSSVMTFQQGQTFAVNGDLNIAGQAGARINIDSVDGATQFTFDVATDQVVSFVDVANSNAATSDILAASSVSSGGNDDAGPSPHWVFVTITPTLYDTSGGTAQLAFNNIRENSDTPRFRASADNAGVNLNRFQFEINTAADFTGTSYTQTFSGTYTSGQAYNFLTDGLSPGLPTTDGVTYYVRVRASADGGSSWGVWSTSVTCCATWSFTYKSAVELADWHQTTDDQFLTGTFSDVTVSGTMSVRLSGGYEMPKFESGAETFDDSLSWTTVNLVNSYTTVPVVIVTPVTAANCEAVGACAGNSTGGGGGMYPLPLVRNVTTTSFELAMCVDGGNATCDTDPGVSSETFHWFAFDVDTADDYDWIEVGTTSGVAVDGSGTAETFTTSFAATPDVWTQAQTYSQGSNIGAHAWVTPKSTAGFTYVGCVHTGAADDCDGTASSETFGYVAIDTANEVFQSAVGFQTGNASISNSVWTTANFSPSFTAPRVMVTQNSENGAQDPQYAWARNVTTANMEFRYCEQDDGTTCNTHNAEDVYWFAVEQHGIATTGTLLSPAVGFDFVPSAVSWDAFDWSEVETNGTVSVQLYYTNSTTCDTLVPDVDLSGNAAGFTSGPVDISGLDTAVYNEVCIQALLQGSGGTPYLSDWEVTYQRRVGPLKGAIIMVD